MAGYPLKDAVCEAIKESRIKVDSLEQLLMIFGSLGVETLDDVEHVTEDDLKGIITPVQARRLLKNLMKRLEEERSRSGEAGAPPHGLQDAPNALIDHPASSTQLQKTDQASSKKGSKTKQVITDSTNVVAIADSTIRGDLHVNAAPTQDYEMETILKDAESYIPTPALDAALEHLETHHCLTLTGCPGSGKTVLAQMILKEMSMKGFKPKTLDTIKKCSIHKDRYVFVVDDIFGSVGFDKDSFKQWVPLLKQLLNKLNSKRVKLIFTTRLSILKEARPYLDTLNQMFENKDVLNVTEEKYMTTDTMKQMLRHHTKVHLKLSEEQIDAIVDRFDIKVAVHGFPHCCELLQLYEHAGTNPERFFETPIKIMKVTLSAIMKNNESIKTLFKIMISSQGEIDLETFEANEPESFNEFIENMIGTFLKQQKTVVGFRHPFLYECVSSVIGEMDPAFILLNAKISYLTYHVVVKEVDDKEEEVKGKTDDTVVMTVYLSRHIEILRERFITEIKDQHFTMIFQHHMWRNKGFVSKVFDQVLDKDVCKQSLLSFRGTKQSAFHWFARSKSNVIYLEAFSRELPICEELKLDAIYGCLVWSNVDGLCSILSKEPTNLVRRKFDGKSVLAHVASVSSSAMCSHLVAKQMIDPTEEDQDGTTALHWAAVAGNTDALMVFLKAGCDVNAKKLGDVTPLHFAVMYEHLETVESLVQHPDCDVNICTTSVEGMDARRREVYIDHTFTFGTLADGTPLIYACICNNPDIVQVLLNAQADALRESSTGQTAFHCACNHDNVKCLRLLVKEYRHDAAVSKWIFSTKTVEPNAEAFKSAQNIEMTECLEYWTREIKDLMPSPFELAFRQGNWKAVVEILTFKPKLHRLVDSLNNHTETLDSLDGKYQQKPLFDGFRIEHLVALSSNVSFMKHLLEYNNTNINMCSNTGWTPFHLALMTGNHNMVTLLLEAGAKVDRLSPSKIPILSLAGKKGTVELAQCLLDHEANINDANIYGGTPLYTAVAFGLHDIVNFFLKKGADVDGKPGALSTPLHCACRIGQEKCVESLINYRADLNAVQYEGCTPLHIATFSDNSEIVSLLIKGRADINSLSQTLQVTALHLASSYGYYDIAKQLFESGAHLEVVDEDGDTSLCRVAVSGHEGILQLHLEHQANLYHQNNEKQTPLMLAIMNDHSAVARKLIEKSRHLQPDITFNLADNDCFTALHHSCDRGHIDITKALLRQDRIDINSLSPIEGTPLMIASKHGFSQIVDLLVAANANVNLATDYGMSALYGACKNGHIDVMKILIESEADVNINYIEGKTPLMVACEKGSSIYSRIPSSPWRQCIAS